MDDPVRGAAARVCRSAVVARGLLLNSIAESRAARVLGREEQEIVANTLEVIERLIERLRPRQGTGA